MVIMLPGGVCLTVDCVWKEVWLSKTTEIQNVFTRCYVITQMLLYCVVVVEILTHRASWKETNKHFML